MTTRVWMVAKEAKTNSHEARCLLQDIGHPVRSASSRVALLPLEREAVVTTLQTKNCGRFSIYRN